MLRVFIDTSVLFSAILSKSGYAHDLIELALNDELTALLSQPILVEVERNILKKAPKRYADYLALIRLMEAEFVEPLPESIEDVSGYVVAKDVHVIAAAIAAKPDYLVTYDHKHLLDIPEVAARSGLKIVTPDVVVAQIHASNE